MLTRIVVTARKKNWTFIFVQFRSYSVVWRS